MRDEFSYSPSESSTKRQIVRNILFHPYFCTRVTAFVCACDTRTLPRDRTLTLPSSRSRNPSKQTKPLKYKDSCVHRYRYTIFSNCLMIHLYTYVSEKKNEIEGKKRDAKRIKGKICEFGICVVIRDTSNGDESEGKGREGRKKKRKENRKLTLFPVSKRIRSIRRETKSIDIRNSTSTTTLKAEM